jgi:hypothetical protein
MVNSLKALIVQLLIFRKVQREGDGESRKRDSERVKLKLEIVVEATYIIYLSSVAYLLAFNMHVS